VGLIKGQYKCHANHITQQLATVPHYINMAYFALLIGKVESYALNKLGNEPAQSRRAEFAQHCTATLTMSMRLPCAHQLRYLYAWNQPLQPGLIHRHWFYLPDAFLYPAIVSTPPLL
jgi:hypothetical protein